MPSARPPRRAPSAASSNLYSHAHLHPRSADSACPNHASGGHARGESQGAIAAQGRRQALRKGVARRRAREVQRGLRGVPKPEAAVQHRAGQPRPRPARRSGERLRALPGRGDRRTGRHDRGSEAVDGRARAQAGQAAHPVPDRGRRDQSRRQAHRQGPHPRPHLGGARRPPGHGPASEHGAGHRGHRGQRELGAHRGGFAATAGEGRRRGAGAAQAAAAPRRRSW